MRPFAYLADPLGRLTAAVCVCPTGPAIVVHTPLISPHHQFLIFYHFLVPHIYANRSQTHLVNFSESLYGTQSLIFDRYIDTD